MKVDSLFYSSTAGIRRGLERMDRTANNIARNGTTDSTSTDTDLVGEFVDLKQEALQIKASLKALHTGDDLLGQFFDDFA